MKNIRTILLVLKHKKWNILSILFEYFTPNGPILSRKNFTPQTIS